MASAGPSARPWATASSMSLRCSAGRVCATCSIVPRPSFGLMPADSSSAPCSAKSFGKKARTTWPKMIGSETFIMVALRCTENNTPVALATAICSVINDASASTRMTVASMTSPAKRGAAFFSTVTVPAAATCSMRNVVSAATVIAFSLP